MKLLSAFLASLLLALPVSASEMRFQFTNPAFGGFPANGIYYLSNAQAQNTHPTPTDSPNSQQNFSNTITNSLLNRVALNIADQIIDSSGGDSGTFSIDDTSIAYSNNGSTITITLTNGATGQSTTIEIPATP